MKPFYFGASQKPLFGIYHQPDPGPYRACGVVLCNPMGDEYVQGHRAFRQLAIHLARAGFHVLRFDYYGCGDSGGESDEGHIIQWRNDVASAIDELKDISGIPMVSLVGARLGASLAALVGFLRNDVKSVVLWEPIVNGKKYVEELIATHQKWLSQHEWVKDSVIIEKHDHENNGQLELLGFPLTYALRRDLENIELMSTERCEVKQLLILEAEGNSDALDVSKHLTTLGVQVDYETTSGPQLWRQQAEGSVLVPIKTLHSIVSWISEDTL